MSDFRLRVQAELDAKNLTSRLNELTKKEYKIPIDINGLNNLSKIDNLKNSLDELQNIKEVKINVDTSSLKLVSSELKNLNSLVKRLEKTNIKFNISDLSKQMQNAGTNAGKSYTSAMQKQVEAMARSQRTSFSEPLKNWTKEQKAYSDWWNKELSKPAYKNYGDNLQKRVQEIKRTFSQGFTDVDISGLRKNLDKYVGMDSDAYKKVEESYRKIISLKKEIETGKSLDSGSILSDSEVVDRFEKINSEFEKSGNYIKVLKNEASGIAKPFNQLDATISSNKTLSWLENNSKAVKSLGKEFEELAQKQRNATSQEELSRYNKEFRNLTSYAQANGLTGKSWLTDAKRAFGDIFEFAGMYSLIQNVAFEVPRQIISAVKDVNAAQIELTKVSDAPQQQLVSYWDEAAESAKKYGATISDVISSTADWSKLGYGLKDSKILSDVTTLYQKVGDNMTQETASQSLISTLQGFNMQADEAESIVDKFNEVKIKAASIFSNEYALCA